MLTTLIILGTFTAFAVGLQCFLNQIITEDLETLQKSQPKPIDDASPS
ncbi:MAG: hypothetical protein AAFV72_17295 [Cyanobacteria bacterium J06635_1]